MHTILHAHTHAHTKTDRKAKQPTYYADSSRKGKIDTGTYTEMFQPHRTTISASAALSLSVLLLLDSKLMKPLAAFSYCCYEKR